MTASFFLFFLFCIVLYSLLDKGAEGLFHPHFFLLFLFSVQDDVMKEEKSISSRLFNVSGFGRGCAWCFSLKELACPKHFLSTKDGLSLTSKRKEK